MTAATDVRRLLLFADRAGELSCREPLSYIAMAVWSSSSSVFLGRGKRRDHHLLLLFRNSPGPDWRAVYTECPDQVGSADSWRSCLGRCVPSRSAPDSRACYQTRPCPSRSHSCPPHTECGCGGNAGTPLGSADSTPGRRLSHKSDTRSGSFWDVQSLVQVSLFAELTLGVAQKGRVVWVASS